MDQAAYAMRREEQVTWQLRALYERHGYRKYRMSKFEAYELYLENINFLKSKSIITFHDLDGRVLAMRPDVTLSIVKNTHADMLSSEKFYYLENVYRLDRPSGAYREISQLGLEYLGAEDAFATGEVVTLALKTLKEISPNCRMQLSHVGYIQSLLESMGVAGAAQKRLVKCIRKKNGHELTETALNLGLSPAAAKMLESAANLCGPFEETIERARMIAIAPGQTQALMRLESVYQMAAAKGMSDIITLDFSLLGDMDYYSGVTFQGFVYGVPRAVLAGGGYAALVRKFGHEIDAIGFAVYLSELSYLDLGGAKDGVDVLLIYKEGDAPVLVAEAAAKLMEGGLTVRCEARAPKELTYKQMMTVKEAMAYA